MPSSPNQHRGLACFHWWRAGEGSKGHVAGGESKNPIVPFSFLFINWKSRQTGHYGETWKHPIPFRPRYVESSCAICTEIVRETWSKPGEEIQISKILLVGVMVVACLLKTVSNSVLSSKTEMKVKYAPPEKANHRLPCQPEEQKQTNECRLEEIFPTWIY